MNLDEKIERSKSTEKIDFSKYQSANVSGPLVKVTGSGKLVVEPCWTVEDDWDGKQYRDYIAEHPEYDGIYLRSEVAKRLKTAANSLDDRYKLVIRAGHRPIGVQRKLLTECAREYKEEHPQCY